MVLEWYQSIPTITFIVLAITVVMNTISNYVIKMKVDIKAEKAVRSEYNVIMREYREAISSKDEAGIEKVKKKQKVIQERMMKQSSARMKSTLYFLLPFSAVWLILGWLVGLNAPTAISPYAFDFYIVKAVDPSGPFYTMSLFTWYFIVSFLTQTVISRLMGTNV